MNSDEDNLNMNLGLSRGSTEADRERYRNYVRAGDYSNGGSWSPPGGLGILLGLFSRPRTRHQSAASGAAPSTPQSRAVLAAIVGAVGAHQLGHPWFAGAIIGWFVGYFATQILKTVVVAAVILFIAAAINKSKQATPAAPSGEIALDSLYDSANAVPPAPPGFRLKQTDMVPFRNSNGQVETWKFRPIYVRE